eukprot:4620237-Amphidinium_carterae.2
MMRGTQVPHGQERAWVWTHEMLAQSVQSVIASQCIVTLSRADVGNHPLHDAHTQGHTEQFKSTTSRNTSRSFGCLRVILGSWSKATLLATCNHIV